MATAPVSSEVQVPPNGGGPNVATQQVTRDLGDTNSGTQVQRQEVIVADPDNNQDMASVGSGPAELDDNGLLVHVGGFQDLLDTMRLLLTEQRRTNELLETMLDAR